MGFRVLIPEDVAESGKQYLRERGYEIKIGSGATVDIIKAEVEDCHAILARTAPYPALEVFVNIVKEYGQYPLKFE